MKKIKNFLKRNVKYSIAFIIGILVHLVAYASTTPLYTANQIGYDNTNTGLESDNVKDALDALYEKAATCEFGSDEEETNTGCPGEGCYYSWNTSHYYTTWNLSSQTPTTINPNSLPSGVSTNYNDVVQYNTFFAMKLNSNNQVEHVYACGIEEGTPFCIEGTYTDNSDVEAIQQANLDILTPIFETCSSVGSDIYCNGEDLNSQFNHGYVTVYSINGSILGHCDIDATGAYHCYTSSTGGGGNGSIN